MDVDAYVAERGDALLRLATVLTGDPIAGEDLTQATLVDVLRRWDRVSGASHPDAYVRRVMLNRFLSWRRRRAASEVLVSDIEPPTRDRQPDPAVALATRDELRRALSGLAPRARAVLVLRYYADMDDGAIAEAMSVSTSAVRATASRALAALRLSMTPAGQENR